MNYNIFIQVLVAVNLLVMSSANSQAKTPQQSIQMVKPVTEHFILSQQQWSSPKNAQSILKIPALRTIMPRLLQDEQQHLVIRYPGGEVGILWASELKAWLVSLGVSSERIEFQTGSIKSNQLELFINNIVLH